MILSIYGDKLNVTTFEYTIQKIVYSICEFIRQWGKNAFDILLNREIIEKDSFISRKMVFKDSNSRNCY